MLHFEMTHEKLGEIPFYLNEKVTHLPGGLARLKGVIKKVQNFSDPKQAIIHVQFEDGRWRKFGTDGVALFDFTKERTLFHGHNVKAYVGGEEAPICDLVHIPKSLFMTSREAPGRTIKLPPPYASQLKELFEYIERNETLKRIEKKKKKAES